MNKTLVSILKYLIFVAIAVGLLYMAFRDVDRDNMLSAIKRANYFWIIAGMACGYLAFVFRGLRWKLLIKPLGYESHSWNSIHSVNIGYLANLAVPRLGEVTRCTVMYRADKVPVDKLFGTVLAERVIDLVMLGGCFLTVLLLKFEDIQTLLTQTKSTNTSIQPTPWMLYLSLFAIGFIFLGALFLKFKTRIMALPLVPKVIGFIKGIGVGLTTVLRLEQRILFIVYTLLIWLMYFLMSYLYFFCLPELAGLGLADGLFVMIVGSLGIIAPAPGGIGAFHAAVIAGLVTLGVNKDLAGTMAIIVHTSQTLMTLLSGLLALFLLSLGRKRAEDGVLQ